MGVGVLGESEAGMDTLADAVSVSKDNDPNSDVLDSAHDSEEGESEGDTSGVDTAGDTAGVDVRVDDVADEMAGENCMGRMYLSSKARNKRSLAVWAWQRNAHCCDGGSVHP